MALEQNRKLQLDISNPNAEIVYATQYDTARIITAQLLDKGQKWYVPNGVAMGVVYKKSDRIGGYYDVTIFGEAAVSIASDRSNIAIRIDQQVTTTPGNVFIQIVFLENRKRLASFEFKLIVQSSEITYADITSKWLFNALMTQGLIVDKTLTVSGAPADAKVTGIGINSKVNHPIEDPNGTAGQLLRTNGDGSTIWVDYGLPTDAQTTTAINAWLNAHPEATTTVEDLSLTIDKFVLPLQLLLDYEVVEEE